MSVRWNQEDADLAEIVIDASGNATSTKTVWRSVRADLGVTAGKVYWEIQAMGSWVGVGVAKNEMSVQDWVGNNPHGWGYWTSGTKWHDNSSEPYGQTYNINDIIGFALDMENGMVWFSKNGVWLGSGDPETLANPAYTGINGTIYPVVSLDDYASVLANFGSDEFLNKPAGYVSIDSLSAQLGVISGVVTLDQNPLAATIRAVKALTGEVVAEVQSNPGDGSYLLDALVPGDSYYIQCIGGSDVRPKMHGPIITTEG